MTGIGESGVAGAGRSVSGLSVVLLLLNRPTTWFTGSGAAARRRFAGASNAARRSLSALGRGSVVRTRAHGTYALKYGLCWSGFGS
jgi:hypothetical protein